MFYNIFFMSLSTLFRLFSGAVLFIALARYLGPELYGVLIYHFSITMMLALVVEYGHSTFIVKKIGESVSDVTLLMNQAIAIKFYLLIVYCFLCVILIFLDFIKPQFIDIFLLMALSSVFLSFGDFSNLAFRGKQKFHKESKVVFWGTLIHFIIVVPCALIYKSIIMVGCGFFISRLLYLVISFMSYKNEFGCYCWPTKEELKPAIVKRNIVKCFPYAADNGLVNIRNYIDVLLVNLLLGSASVGLYQTGMNIVRSIENFSPILANVYLPKLASVKDNKLSFNIHALNLFYLMSISGFIGLTLFTVCSEKVVNILFGTKYIDIVSLFPMFGVFVLARFSAVTQGVIVTVYGFQKNRVYAGLFALFALIVTSVFFMRLHGLAGAVMANVIVTIFLILYFLFLLNAKKISSGICFYLNCLLSILIVSLFLFFKV